MTPRQIENLAKTEKRLPLGHVWHFRRTPATAMRDAIWESWSERGGWSRMPYPPPKSKLFRLIPAGYGSDAGLRWMGFHDPEHGKETP